MKNTLKKAGILWLLLMCGAWLVFTNWATIINPTPKSEQHTLQLHSLFLWSTQDTGASWIKSNSDNLDILNGLIVWTKDSIEKSIGKLIAVWWWEDNEVKGNNSWIWGWKGNKFFGEYNNSAIGWWEWNKIQWDSSTIAWWWQNTTNENWVVVWWQNNTASNWVALWWSGNKANGKNSLVMWEKISDWAEWSFAWNDGSSSNFIAPDNSARIDTNSWVLIWTFNPIKWVALVVSWAIKLWKGDNDEKLSWEMKVDNWCIRVYDGNNWHYLGGSCNKDVDGSWCQFGKTYLLNGDQAIGYKNFYAKKCTWEKVTCNGWVLDKNLFPYCYEVDTDPEYKKTN